MGGTTAPPITIPQIPVSWLSRKSFVVLSRFPLFLSGDFLTPPWLTPLLHTRFTWQKTHTWCKQNLQPPTHSGGRKHQGSMFDGEVSAASRIPSSLATLEFRAWWCVCSYPEKPQGMWGFSQTGNTIIREQKSLHYVDLWRLMMMWSLCCRCRRCCSGILQLRLQPRCLLLAADDVTLFLDSIRSGLQDIFYYLNFIYTHLPTHPPTHTHTHTYSLMVTKVSLRDHCLISLLPIFLYSHCLDGIPPTDLEFWRLKRFKLLLLSQGWPADLPLQTHVCKPHTEVCLLNSTLNASLVLEGHKNQTVDVKTVCLNIVVDHRHCLQIDPNTLEVCLVQSSQQQHSESRGAQLCLYRLRASNCTTQNGDFPL